MLPNQDGDDAGAVALLVAHRLGEAAEEPEREFILYRVLGVVLLQLANSVLQLGLVAAVIVGHQCSEPVGPG